MVDSSPSRSTVSRNALLLLRVLTFLFLLIALILIAIASVNDDTGAKIKFSDFYTYRYMIATIIIGFVYNLLQMAFSIFTVVSGGNRVLSGDGGYLFDFFGDKIISYLLISGSAAGFGLTVELHRGSPSNSLTDKANASASLLLIGFIFTAIASTFTSFALPKKANN